MYICSIDTPPSQNMCYCKYDTNACYNEQEHIELFSYIGALVCNVSTTVRLYRQAIRRQ